jgi:hypothetical protein
LFVATAMPADQRERVRSEVASAEAAGLSASTDDLVRG